MSVEITVSWCFVPHGTEVETPEPSFGSRAEIGDDDAAPMAHGADRVVPQGSSVVAPGLAVVMPV